MQTNEAQCYGTYELPFGILAKSADNPLLKYVKNNVEGYGMKMAEINGQQVETLDIDTPFIYMQLMGKGDDGAPVMTGLIVDDPIRFYKIITANPRERINVFPIDLRLATTSTNAWETTFPFPYSTYKAKVIGMLGLILTPELIDINNKALTSCGITAAKDKLRSKPTLLNQKNFFYAHVKIMPIIYEFTKADIESLKLPQRVADHVQFIEDYMMEIERKRTIGVLNAIIKPKNLGPIFEAYSVLPETSGTSFPTPGGIFDVPDVFTCITDLYDPRMIRAIIAKEVRELREERHMLSNCISIDGVICEIPEEYVDSFQSCVRQQEWYNAGKALYEKKKAAKKDSVRSSVENSVRSSGGHCVGPARPSDRAKSPSSGAAHPSTQPHATGAAHPSTQSHSAVAAHSHHAVPSTPASESLRRM